MLAEGPHPDTYKLGLTTQFRTLHPIFHTRLLKPYRDPGGSRHRAAVGAPPPAVLTPEGDEWEIEKIVAEKTPKRGKKRYLVKWTGYAHSENTWEDADVVEKTVALQRWIDEKKR